MVLLLDIWRRQILYLLLYYYYNRTRDTQVTFATSQGSNNKQRTALPRLKKKKAGVDLTLPSSIDEDMR